MSNHFARPTGRLITTLLLLGILAAPLAGCDSDGTSDSIEIRGRVSDDASSGLTTGPIEGATVTAAEVGAGGSVNALQGTATSDADGEYMLDTEGTASAVVLTATEGSFTTRALIEAGGAASGTVSAPTMTAETNAEVDVFLAARGMSGSDVTVPDVAFYVNRDLAGRISGGTAAASDVAEAITAAASAEASYASERGAGGTSDDAAQEREDAYATYRAAVFAATTTTAGTTARLAFERAYAGAYSEGGASVDVQAGAGLAASAAAARFSGDLSSGASFDLRRQARVNAALAAALAVEEQFRAAGGTARLTALAEAREDLVVAIGTALNDNAIADAVAEYRTFVVTQLAEETEVSLSDLASAEAATLAARTALATALTAAVDAGDIGEAVATFHAAARTAIETSLGTGVPDLAVDVLVLLVLNLASAS